jgi:hypothetical protein
MKLYDESIINSIVDIYRTSPINPNYPHGMDCEVCKKAGIECYTDSGDGYECNTGYVNYLEQKLVEIKQPTVNAIIIPEGATNGDMIKALFSTDIRKESDNMICADIQESGLPTPFWKDWWNAPYKKEVKE